MTATGPKRATARPAAWLARRAASTGRAAGGQGERHRGDTVSPAPVTSDTSRATAGRSNSVWREQPHAVLASGDQHGLASRALLNARASARSSSGRTRR